LIVVAHTIGWHSSWQRRLRPEKPSWLEDVVADKRNVKRRAVLRGRLGSLFSFDSDGSLVTLVFDSVICHFKRWSPGHLFFRGSICVLPRVALAVFSV
jgi:hypothetical protein